MEEKGKCVVSYLESKTPGDEVGSIDGYSCAMEGAEGPAWPVFLRRGGCGGCVVPADRRRIAP